ncbi:unnamed protein product [Agarophyton chilense]
MLEPSRDSHEVSVASQEGLSPVPNDNCFDAIFLRSLVLARVFGKNIKEVSQLTDEIIKEKLSALSSNGRAVSYDELMADVKRSISIDALEPDACLRIIGLQTAYLDLCDRRGWDFVDTAPKAAVRQIPAVVKSPELKTRLHYALKLEESEIEDDFFGFYKSESKISSATDKSDEHVEESVPQASSSSEKSSTIPALVVAKLSGFKFAYRVDSGADEVAVSDTIIQFPGDKGTFLPTLQLSKAKTFKAVDVHTFKSPGMVQLCPTITTVAGPCRLRNIKAYIMPCNDNTLLPGAYSTVEIVLGNPFLVPSGLDVTDFLANNIYHLSSLDYGALNTVKHPVKVGKLAVRLLTDQPVQARLISLRYLLAYGTSFQMGIFL